MDLYLHIVKNTDVETIKKGFAGTKESKHYDPSASADDVNNGLTQISKCPSYWICEYNPEEVPAGKMVEDIVGEDFPTLSTHLRDRIVEVLSHDRQKYRQVRADSRAFSTFLDLYMNSQCFTFVW